MGGTFRSYLLFLLLPILLILHATIIHNHHHHNNNDDNAAADLALSTNSRWIVDDRNGGERVKLSCVNWLGSTTMRQSLQKLGLSGSVAGVQLNNPSLVDLPLVNVFQEVVSNLNENNVMIILDNHLSKTGWCCNDNDRNGFFGDLYFDPEVWVEGIGRVASMFKDYNNVVGMSLRNELRGRRQNLKTWYKYMQKGAERVHATNPNVLVIISGLNYDLDLSFLRTNPLSLSFSNKLVLEIHWYGFSDGDDWIMGNSNEWGVDQRGTNDNDNRYLNCLLGLAAEHDLDWALWTLVGSYYYREGVIGMEEFYGLLNWNWGEPRNSSFLKKISPLQSPFSSIDEHKLLFHPATGLCMQSHSLSLGPCSDALALDYTSENILSVKGTNHCIQANEVHMPVRVVGLLGGVFVEAEEQKEGWVLVGQGYPTSNRRGLSSGSSLLAERTLLAERNGLEEGPIIIFLGEEKGLGG
ncbi:hypothetical protein L1987_62077 [Smallanthus sonchifolius]|uniref:Uncharacterized protein n=1 Tax=Smallanthus sonchifolius TaxID=185202 RepID=A0ACB9C9F7_9ASTR|nr:hypothetical protein L1987_62077 [Smallanthus sonchifolius]